MKKILTATASFVLFGVIFLLLPRLPFTESWERGWELFGVFPMTALIFGGLIPFVCKNDKTFALIESGIFFAFALTIGLLDSLAATLCYMVIFAFGIFSMIGLKALLPIRFDPAHRIPKLIFSVFALAAVIGVFFLWASYRPEGIYSMALDGLHMTFLFLYFPIFSILYGFLLEIFAFGDNGYKLILTVMFGLGGFFGLLYSGITLPYFAIIYVLIMLAATFPGKLWAAITIPNS